MNGYNNNFPYVWYWKKRLPDRRGQPCRILARGKLNSILVEFKDGYTVITSRYAVRKKTNRGKSEEDDMKAQHTPGPWKIFKHQRGFYGIQPDVSSNVKGLANAEFIVHACNAFDDLLEACNDKDDRKVYDILENSMARLGEDEGNSNRVIELLEIAQTMLYERIKVRRKAIAKAKSKIGE